MGFRAFRASANGRSTNSLANTRSSIKEKDMRRMHLLWIRARPRDADAYTSLAAAHLQSARETGDPGAYDRAGSALRLVPDHPPSEYHAAVAAARRLAR
jgi:hypothetical protein